MSGRHAAERRDDDQESRSQAAHPPAHAEDGRVLHHGPDAPRPARAAAGPDPPRAHARRVRGRRRRRGRDDRARVRRRSGARCLDDLGHARSARRSAPRAPRRRRGAGGAPRGAPRARLRGGPLRGPGRLRRPRARPARPGAGDASRDARVDRRAARDPGRRVGLDVRPVPFPGHFLVRVAGVRPVFVDPASGGLLDEGGLLDIACEELDTSRAAAAVHLAPADARALAVRLLQNLGRAHRARGDEGRALLVADRLFEVSGAGEDRLDRALSLWALGAYEAAQEDLGAFLATSPEAPDRALFERARARLAALDRDLH
ncbi:MAG: transglutaminase family protein [Sandaracinaceae bacterium]